MTNESCAIHGLITNHDVIGKDKQKSYEDKETAADTRGC